MEESQSMESLYLLAQKKRWKPHFPGMSHDLMQYFFLGCQYPVKNSWNAPMPCQTLSPQKNQNQPTQNW